MDSHELLAMNLKAIRHARQMSMTEFSAALDVPKSTLQSVMSNGQTTLNTAVRISERLGMPLDALINDNHIADKTSLLSKICRSYDCFSRLSRDRQQQALAYITSLLEIFIEENSHE